MREDRYYKTGDEKIDNALNRLHRLTQREPSDWRVPGEQFEGILHAFISTIEQLPEDHPVRIQTPYLYTQGTHVSWKPDDTRAFYERLIEKIRPALDAVEDAPSGTPSTPDPKLQQWRERADKAHTINAKYNLCVDIYRSDSTLPMLLDAAGKAMWTLKGYLRRSRFTQHDQMMIDRAWYKVTSNL